MTSTDLAFADLHCVASHFRSELAEPNKKFVLLYAYNGTGKTRLSTAFKDLGKDAGDEEKRDTLYFNAFTEDLFSWDNDLDNDSQRVLKINRSSRFFDGLAEMEMDNRIRPLLNRYADFDFRIDTDAWEISFSRNVLNGESLETIDNIKVARGEENIFIWCFFLAVVQLCLDGSEAYDWVRYIYIDDPISSLDDNNAIAVAHHITETLRESDSSVGVVISSHHTLFFNVACNQLPKKKEASKYFLKLDANSGFILEDTSSTPFLHHLSSLVEMDTSLRSGKLYAYHFNTLRRTMEQTASFFHLGKWSDCIQPQADDPDQTVYKRVIDVMSHGDHTLYEPREMVPDNKELFRRIFEQFVSDYPFNPELFAPEPTEATTA